MQTALAGQANILSVDMVGVDGELTTGTTTCYLRVTSGDNAGKWVTAAGGFASGLVSCGTASYVRGSEWEISIPAAAWIDGVKYRLSADHSSGDDIGYSDEVFCTGTVAVHAEGATSVVSVAEARSWLKRTTADDTNLAIALEAAEDFIGGYVGTTITPAALAADKKLRVAILALAGHYMEHPEDMGEAPAGVVNILTQSRGIEP